MPLLYTLAPKVLSYIFDRLKAKKASAGVQANPKATTTGTVTIIVTFITMYATSQGLDVTPEVKENLSLVVFGLGGLYTWYRAEK